MNKKKHCQRLHLSPRHLVFLVVGVGMLAGCSRQPPYDRKADLESWLPEYVTTYARRHWPPTTDKLDRIRMLCGSVTLTKESEGHYTGIAHFMDGGHPQIDVVDDGKNVQFKLSTVNDWGNARVPPVD